MAVLDPSTVEPSIAAIALGPLLDRIDALGLDSASILEARGIDPGAIEDEAVRLPISLSDRIWEDAAVAAGDPDFALGLAASIGPRSFGLLTYIATASATLGDSYRRLGQHYAVLSSAASYHLGVDGERARLTVELRAAARRPRQVVDFLVAVAYCLGQSQCADAWTAEQVCFRHAAPADLTGYRQLFSGARLEFEAAYCGFELDRRALALPQRRADPGLLAILERHAGELRRRESGDDVAAQVRLELAAAMASDAALSVEAIAKSLGTSPRTLRRRLSAAGTSFSEQLNGLRRGAAVRLLDGGHTPTSVSHALGFSDPRAFVRAFRRWFAITPTAYRQAREAGGSPTGSAPVQP